MQLFDVLSCSTVTQILTERAASQMPGKCLYSHASDKDPSTKPTAGAALSLKDIHPLEMKGSLHEATQQMKA